MTHAESISINVPRVVISGTKKGVGVSSLVLGLLVFLKRKGLSVSSAQIGPNLVTTTHHRRVTGRFSNTLDPWLLSVDEIRESCARATVGAEILVIEGSRGLYDERDSESCLLTDADMAKAINAPVILVVDAEAFEESILAYVTGFVNYSSPPTIVGVILNHVKSREHGERLASVLSRLNGVRLLGSIPESVGDKFAGAPSLRYIENESLMTRNQLLRLGNLIQSHVDFEAFLNIAKAAKTFTVPISALNAKPRQLKFAVADDQAFHLTVHDNLDILRLSGVELIPFSPLADSKLPAGISGVYLPSSYLHIYAAELQANQAMREALWHFAQANGQIYAEGASVGYLCEQVTLVDGVSYDMTNILGGSAACMIQPMRKGEWLYDEATILEPVFLGRFPDVIRGLHESRWNYTFPETVKTSIRVRQRRILLEDKTLSQEVFYDDGFFNLPKVLATKSQFHWGSNKRVAEIFISKCK